VTQLYHRLGAEFVANTATAENQLMPAMARLASGGFVIVWASQTAAGGSDFQIRGQLHGADGSRVGAEFAISPGTGFASEPRVAALSTGGFVVSWTHDAQDGTGSGAGGGAEAFRVKAQMFHSAAAKVGAEWQVGTGTGTDNYDSQVIGLADGRFAVSWTRDTFGFAIQRDAVTQVFDPASAAQNPRTTLSASTAGSQSATAIAALAGGGFVATWSDTNSASSPDPAFSVRGVLLDAAGVKIGSEFFVNTTVAGIQNSPSVAALATGGFVVAWTDYSQTGGDSSDGAIRAQIFDSAGAKVGGELLVNSSTAGLQALASVTGLSGGGFVVAWRDGTQTDGDVRMQAFDSAGARQGTEFVAATATEGLQNLPVVIGLANGGFAAAWADQSNHGGTLSEIKAQIFAPGAGTPGDIALSTTTISETAFENDSVATLSNAGAVNAGYTYQIVADGSWGGFRIEGDRLVVADNARLDFEGAPQVSVTIRVTETRGQSHDETFALAIADNPSAAERRYASSGEFIANVTQAGETHGGVMVPLASGGFALVWTHLTLNGVFDDRALLRFFDSAGAPASGEIVIVANQLFSELVATKLAGGGLVVAYRSFDMDAGTGAIRAQAYDGAGNAVGPQMVAGSSASQPGSPLVVQLSTGGFVISWQSEAGLLAQRFDSSGAPVGGEILIAENPISDQHALVATASGGFASAWAASDDPFGDGPYRSKAQFFDSSGAATGAQISRAAGDLDLDNLALLALADGGYLLGWVEQVGHFGSLTTQAVKAQRLDSGGAALGDPVTLTGLTVEEDYGPDVRFAAHPGGGFVLTWPTADLADPDSARVNYDFPFPPDYSLHGRLFDSSGAAAGSAFQIVSLGQDGVVAILADGTIATAWSGSDSSGSGLLARLYRPANAPVDNQGNDNFAGDSGDNLIDGGPGNDFLRLEQGGDDVALGGPGNDVFLFGGTLNGADTIDGGTGTDQIAIQGDYAEAEALTLGSNVVSVENLAILPGNDMRFGDPGTNFYSYEITAQDIALATGVQLVVDANRLRPGENLTFNGSAESDGSFFIYGGGGNDLLTGGAKNDVFIFGHQGQWGTGDVVTGGAGIDQLALRGNYTIVFGANQLVGVEQIGMVSAQDTRYGALGSSYNYDLTMVDSNVDGIQMTVDAAPLRPGETLTFNGSAEDDGSFRVFGGRGDDTIVGSQNGDILAGNGGSDQLTGGGGGDAFRYVAASDSAPGSADRILDFLPGTDWIDLSRIDADTHAAGNQAFRWIGSNGFTGSNAASAGELRAYQSGNSWFVEGDTDGNGAADLVIELTVIGPTPLEAGHFLL
jgi:Ca2+-binding RTX toxin-like protein